ncbi:MAG: hypothetical protein K0R34_71 [Herbinix sp.]|jgi:uncharacterized protein YggE|nr:hypothetical protein [Herbinix sp.]
MDINSMKDVHDHNVMILGGRGEVSAVPDIAVLRLGVQTVGENLQLIQAENAKTSQAVLQALYQLGITEIQTFQYDISKLYEYVDGRQLDKGYSVRNIFEIRTDNMGLVGTIIDTAVRYGANVVEFINFEVSDTNRYYLQALNLAIANAYEKAASIADNLRLPMHPFPRRITENSTPPIPFRAINLREGAFATPIEAGTNQIEASVTVEFTY